MSGRGHRCNRHRGCEGGGRPLFFYGRCSSFGKGRRREILLVNPPTPSSNEETHFEDEVFHEIEDYFDEVEKGEPIQAGDPP